LAIPVTVVGEVRRVQGLWPEAVEAVAELVDQVRVPLHRQEEMVVLPFHQDKAKAMGTIMVALARMETQHP